MDEEPEPADAPDAAVLGEVRGDVELRHVCFGYTAEQEIIHDLSLKAPKGKWWPSWGLLGLEKQR